MRKGLLLSLLLTAGAAAAARGAAAAPQGQTAPAPKPATPPATTQKPAQPPATTAPAPAATAPPARRAPAAAANNARGGMAITVTDGGGATIGAVKVAADGPTQRSGETNGSGQVNFPGLQAGVYRLRFDGDDVVSFEKEVTVRTGQVLSMDVMLTPAKKAAPPPPAPVAPEPVAAAPVTGPTGSPQALSLYDLAERELRAKQPRREILVSCSANTRTTVVLLDQDQSQRIYEGSEVGYYVLGGQANFRVAAKDNVLAAGGYVSVPRGTPFSIARRGKGPVSLLFVLNGEPCETAR